MINPYRKASKRELQYKARWVKSVAMPWFDVVYAVMKQRALRERKARIPG